MATMQAKSVRRREDLRLLTGQGNYAADAAPAELAVATFLRSPTRMPGLRRSTWGRRGRSKALLPFIPEPT